MKFTVSEILVSYIKSIRKERKITVTEFANRIGKSKSYITKFDNCEFKTLTLEDFQTIFNALFIDSPEEANNAMDGYFLSLLKDGYDEQSVDLNIDISNYSYLIKRIEIPTDLIAKINLMINKSNFTIDEIVEYANANIAVKHFANFNSVDYNEYVPIPISDCTDEAKIYIKIKLDSNDIHSILKRKSLISNYFTLLAFANAYYIMDLKNNESISENSKPQMAAILARNLLFNFQVYALVDYFKIQKSKENVSELTKNLEAITHSMQSTLGGFMELVSHIYKQNPIYTEDKILGMNENLEADAAFFFASLDLPLYKLKHLNTDTKKKLLKDFRDLIDKYAEDEDYQNQLELL